MKERIDIGRREFSASAILAMLSGVAITMTGCGGGSSSPTQPTSTTGTGTGTTTTGTSTGTDKSGTVSSNHGHSAVVTSVQLTAGGGVSLNIQGSANHPHTVNLSGAQLSAIAGGQRVSTESTSDAGHSHTVSFN